jgi:hypothetical protein
VVCVGADVEAMGVGGGGSRRGGGRREEGGGGGRTSLKEK